MRKLEQTLTPKRRNLGIALSKTSEQLRLSLPRSPAPRPVRPTDRPNRPTVRAALSKSAQKHEAAKYEPAETRIPSSSSPTIAGGGA